MKKSRLVEPYPPEILTELATSRLRSSFLMVALQLDLFKKLDNKKFKIEDFANLTSLPLASARVLGQNLANLGLLNYNHNKIVNSDLARKYLIDDKITKELINYLNSFYYSPQELIKLLKNHPEQPWYAIK